MIREMTALLSSLAGGVVVVETERREVVDNRLKIKVFEATTDFSTG